MKKKRILCFIASLGSGGAERQMLKLIELLNSKGITPFVLTYCDMSLDYPNKASMHRYNIDTKNKTKRNISLIKTMIDIKPDVIISYLPDANKVALIYRKLFWFKNINLIISERNFTNWELSKREKVLYWSYQFADAIVCNSESQSRFLNETYPQYENKIYTITNYIEFDKFKDSEKKINSTKKILIPARFHEQKNVIGFLKALTIVNEIKDISPFECIWIGDNTFKGEISEYYKECVKFKNDHGINNITFLNYKKNIYDLYSEADILCLLSLFEGFSNSLSEGIVVDFPLLRVQFQTIQNLSATLGTATLLTLTRHMK